jgi:hypothetical protein
VTRSDEPTSDAPKPILSYAGPETRPESVTIYRTSDLAEAQLLAGELVAEGINCSVSHTLTAALGAWGGSAKVLIEVAKPDAERAAEILRLRNLGDDLEPAADDDDQSTDEESGEPLVIASAYDNASRMRDAVTTLGSANVRAYTPRLVPRGDRPRGEGNRFVVRVRQSDLERAGEVLGENDEDASDADTKARGDVDEPRCPKCSSWRVHRESPMSAQFLRFIRLRSDDARSDPLVCLACGHRWTPESHAPAG